MIFKQSHYLKDNFKTHVVTVISKTCTGVAIFAAKRFVKFKLFLLKRCIKKQNY